MYVHLKIKLKEIAAWNLVYQWQYTALYCRLSTCILLIRIGAKVEALWLKAHLDMWSLWYRWTVYVGLPLEQLAAWRRNAHTPPSRSSCVRNERASESTVWFLLGRFTLEFCCRSEQLTRFLLALTHFRRKVRVITFGITCVKVLGWCIHGFLSLHSCSYSVWRQFSPSLPDLIKVGMWNQQLLWGDSKMNSFLKLSLPFIYLLFALPSLLLYSLTNIQIHPRVFFLLFL